MAFPIDEVTYGAGNFDIDTIDTEQANINSYAHVTAISSTTITVDMDTAHIRGYEDFNATEAEVLFHVSASAGTETAHLGKWSTGKITKRSADILTVDFDPTDVIPAADLSKYHCQLVVIPRFANLTIGAGKSTAPRAYDPEKYHGGIVALKCSGTLTLDGGHIDLRERGIPTDSKALRPLTLQEQQGTLDTDKYSGWENSQTKERFLLNCGNGAAFIIAKKLVVSNTASRIGEVTTAGVQFCRGATDSYDLPTGVTNIGGSTILIAAETITGFDPAIIAKYRLSNKDTAAGQGLARCYIASETVLRNDEGLYAYDCLHNPDKLTSKCNIRNFGNGEDATAQNVTRQLNNYATVTAVDGAKVTYKDKTTAGLARIERGALVMVHLTHKSEVSTAWSGQFNLAKVLEDDGTTLLLGRQLNTLLHNDIAKALTNYHVQIVSIPQYENFTLSTENAATMQFDGEKGGIFALACKDTCDLSGGTINVEGKGGGTPYGRSGLATIGNAQDNNKLPIGEGHGSVFILAKNLTMNSSTRIGATYSGAEHSGYLGEPDTSNSPAESGSGAKGGRSRYEKGLTSARTGGYGSNGSSGSTVCENKLAVDSVHDHRIKSCQGAHVMIIADTITGFNQAAISTGGEKGAYTSYTATDVVSGKGKGNGAGYGGEGGHLGSTYAHGGYNGGGGGSYHTYKDTNTTYLHTNGAGGSSGWAFIWCNNVVNQDTTDTVLFD